MNLLEGCRDKATDLPASQSLSAEISVILDWGREEFHQNLFGLLGILQIPITQLPVCIGNQLVQHGFQALYPS
jgi:hypothetical protein